MLDIQDKKHFFLFACMRYSIYVGKEEPNAIQSKCDLKL